MKVSKSEQREAIARLRELLHPGDTVYTIVRSVSRSSMSRTIDCYTILDGGMRYLSGWAATALGYSRTEQGAMKVSGCGMDMGFAVVYDLSCTLWPHGYGCTGEGCRSNDHSNGDRDYTPHGNGMTPHRREVLIGADHWHNDGGYALRQEWL